MVSLTQRRAPGSVSAQYVRKQLSFRLLPTLCPGGFHFFRQRLLLCGGHGFALRDGRFGRHDRRRDGRWRRSFLRTAATLHRRSQSFNRSVQLISFRNQKSQNLFCCHLCQKNNIRGGRLLPVVQVSIWRTTRPTPASAIIPKRQFLSLIRVTAPVPRMTRPTSDLSVLGRVCSRNSGFRFWVAFLVNRRYSRVRMPQ